MGYVTKDISVIAEPKILSLSEALNFVAFESKPSAKTPYKATIKINASASIALNKTLLQILISTGETLSFMGTTDSEEVGGTVFFVDSLKSNTAENLRNALENNSFINSNFNVIVPPVWSGNTPSNGETIYLESKRYGSEFNLTISAPNNTGNDAYTLAVVSTSVNGDSISGESSTAEIGLDVYEGADVFLGADDKPNSPTKLGKKIVSLNKTYVSGTSIWFELNKVFSQYAPFKIPPDVVGWFDPLTMRVFRFVAKVKGVNSYPFYYSNAVFVLTGKEAELENFDLTPYVFDNIKVKLLTNKPRTPYILGQKEYLNFIFSDPLRGVNAYDFDVQISYRAFNTAGEYLGAVYGQVIHNTALNMMNTCVLSIPDTLAVFPEAGIIRVGLARGPVLVSNELEYTVLPAPLHDSFSLTFLNRLGGWDSINLDARPVNEATPTYETYSKTITPDTLKGDSSTKIYTANIAKSVTVESSPLTDSVAVWLRELAESKCVLDSEGNYIRIEEFSLKMSDDNKNMQVLTLKFTSDATIYK